MGITDKKMCIRDRYEHLAYLNELTAQNAQLAAALGNDYLVAPDVVIYRDLYEDSEINAAQCIVDGGYSQVKRWKTVAPRQRICEVHHAERPGTK